MKRSVLVAVVVLVACSRSDPSTSTHEGKHEDRHDPALAAPALQLAVTIDGSSSKWQQDVFDKTPHFQGIAHDGDSRDTWSLRELFHQAVGPTARVVAVVGEARMPIDPVAWNDPDRTPSVHRTRRGWLKFRWADKTGAW
jgi:hypothetical protein